MLDIDLVRQELLEHVLDALRTKNIQNPSTGGVRMITKTYFQERNLFLPISIQTELIDELVYVFCGLGPIEPLLEDESITEIMVNGAKSVFIERKGVLEQTNIEFQDNAHVIRVINKIVGKVGRRIDQKTPLVDARLEDGSRVNAIINPLSLSGPVLTIRKFSQFVFSFQSMLEKNSLSLEMVEFLTKAIKAKQNVLISGGTGAGKTSTLNACSACIPTDQRIITLEDVAEIRIDHPHHVALESRLANIEGEGEIPIRTLLKNALRMRPDRIIVGEVRGAEVIDMLQAMNTGHKGSLTTVHANTPLESLYRMETMVLMGESEIPLSAIRPQIIQALDIVVQQQRFPDGSRKISHIAAVKQSNLQEYEVDILFWFDKREQKFCSNKDLVSNISFA